MKRRAICLAFLLGRFLRIFDSTKIPNSPKVRSMSSVRASHILLMYAGSDRSSNNRSKADAESLIAELKAKVDAGADFGELAKAHSDCPSGKSGGDLGNFGKGMMVKPFEDATFSMSVGQVSDVVETGFGFHIIQRTG